MGRHIPVMLPIVLSYLAPAPNKHYIDCTAGGGGYVFPLLEKTAPQGKILAIDFDPLAIRRLTEARQKSSSWQKRLVLVNDNFRNLKKIYDQVFPYSVSGILFDLGFSRDQIKETARGFSFQEEGPLDMRFNPRRQKLTAAEIVNNWPEEKLVEIFRLYGEEPAAPKLARAIIQERRRQPFRTTLQLADFIKKILARRAWGGQQGKHPATRIFQALRIVVNEELDNLRQGLPQAVEILDKGGRIVVLSYHSLEDRIVKNFFREKAKEKGRVLTPRPQRPSQAEIAANPSARSAKLRVWEKDR